MKSPGTEFKKEIKGFIGFVKNKENRKTILMVAASVMLVITAGYIKDLVSGGRYITAHDGTVAGVLRNDEERIVSFPLTVEAEKNGDKRKKNVTLTIQPDTGKNRSEDANKSVDDRTVFENELSELLSGLSRSAGKKIMLPLSLKDGTKLKWSKGQDLSRLVLLMMMPLLIWALYLNGEKKKRDREKKCIESVRKSLPAFNDQLVLLMGSGLIFRDAFLKIAEGYRRRKKQSFFEKKMIEVCDEVESGVSDIVTVFGRKADDAGITEFSRLTAVIKDNQLHGVDISGKLRTESVILWDLRRKYAEEQGRLAETKLTMPLAVLLIVLVLVTAAPAVIQVEGG